MKVCSPLEDDVQRIKKQRSYRVFNFFIYPATGALFSFALAAVIVYIDVAFFQSVCQRPLKLWLLVAAIALFIHGFVFSFQLPYGIYKITKPPRNSWEVWAKPKWRKRLMVLGNMIAFVGSFFWIVYCSWGVLWLYSDYKCPPELRWATVGLVSLLGSANAFVILPYFCWLKRGVFPCFAACFFCCRRSDNGAVHDSYQALPVFE